MTATSLRNRRHALTARLSALTGPVDVIKPRGDDARAADGDRPHADVAPG